MIPHVNETRNKFGDEDLEYDLKERAYHVKWYHYVLLNRPLKIILSLLIVAILTPILIYQLAFYSARRVSTTDGFSVGSCLIPIASRIPCGLGSVTAEDCHHQCCYDAAHDVCFHRFPSRFSYIMDQQWTEDVLLRPRVSTVPFKSQSSLTNIKLSLDEVSTSHLTITFYNSGEHSFNGRRIESKDYEVQISSAELNVVVNSLGRTIFNTVRGPLIASENIWEVAFKLTEGSMYGFGEIPIKGNTEKIIYNHKGGWNSIPLIFAKTNDTYHGLLIDTVNPTEVSFREDNAILIRSITNFGLKFHVFVGPKPADVMKDVKKFKGFKKDVEYWMLGAHVCSELEETPKSTAELNNFIREAATQNMPFESHCVMPVVFDDACETEPAAIINEGATILHNAGKRFIPHVSPYIRYKQDEEIEEVEDENNQDETRSDICNSNVQDSKDFMLQNSEATGLYIGSAGNYDVVYPNYKNVTEELMEKLWVYTKEIDGVVLENSFPLDETEKLVNETKLFLPYFNERFEKAFTHTPQWNATYGDGEKFIYTHNKYGNHFADAFDKIKNVPVWLSSHWMNSNTFSYRQEITTSWQSLQDELIETALGGISGQFYWSTPICGDTDNFDSTTHLQLCLKWYLAATYLPMIRIHSKGTPRDPLSFQGTHRSLMINALKTRISLAPYFYTTLQEDEGSPLLRPMFYQFPESEALKDLTSQFSVGNDLIIVPNLQPNQAMVHMTMPPGPWYELWSGFKAEGKEGEVVTVATTEADFFTAIRGGAIVVHQKDVKLTAEATRSQAISLIIALNCDTDNESRTQTTCQAEGKYYLSENITIHFFADDTRLTVLRIGDMNPVCEGIESTMPTVKEIDIYGLDNTMNNYDDKRHVKTDIKLCELISGEILFDFTSEVV